MRTGAAFLVVALVALPVAADPIGFGTSGTTLLGVDLGTPSSVAIGPMGGGFMESLAQDAAGNLFSADTSGILYSVNRDTGVATQVAPTGLGNLEGFDFSGTTLLSVDFSGPNTIRIIDTTDGSSTPLVTPIGLTGFAPDAMAVKDAETVILATRGGPQTSPTAVHHLESVDLTSGEVTLIHSFAPGTPIITGLDFDADGLLYTVDLFGFVRTLDLDTGVLTDVGPVGSVFLGLALNGQAIPEEPTPVPEDIAPDVQSDPIFGGTTFNSFSQDDQEIVITVLVHLTGVDPGQALKDEWEAGAESIWGNQYQIQDGTNVYDIVLDLQFVTFGGGLVNEVEVVAGNGLVDLVTWYTGTPSGWTVADAQGRVTAHEVGHMLGLYDEYAGGTLDPITMLVDEMSIMGGQLGTPRARHYQSILSWFQTEGSTDAVFALAPGFDPGEAGPVIGETPPVPIPEPGTMVLMGALTAMAAWRRRKRAA